MNNYDEEVQKIEKFGQENGWHGIEIEHAIDNLDVNYENETIIPITNGREIRCPAYPEECEYVRITQNGYELAYWTSEEWERDGKIVMGAIMGCARGA
jgi:hypothetical protein